MNTIGILTSGGDSPGMNAAVWSAVKYAMQHGGIKIYGIRNGYRGLIEGEHIQLDSARVDGIHSQGGTILGSARCPAMKTPEGQAAALANINRLGIEGMIVVGGDGSFQGARVLSQMGVPTIGLPGTIDNDLNYTDYTIGFDTACNTAMDAVMKIRDTMKSHDRIAIVEVMGRHCGDIATTVGMGMGADFIIIPELENEYPDEFNLSAMADRILALRRQGKRFGVIITAEGVCYAKGNVRAAILREQLEEALAQKQKAAEEKFSFDIRDMVLAHIQRGGCPTAFDRRIAIEMAARAVELLVNGTGNRVVGITKNKIFDEDILLALGAESKFDRGAIDMALKLSEKYIRLPEDRA